MCEAIINDVETDVLITESKRLLWLIGVLHDYLCPACDLAVLPSSIQIMIDTQELPGMAGHDQREAILTNPDNLAVCTIIKLLRTIAVNGFRCECLYVSACVLLEIDCDCILGFIVWMINS